MFRLINVQSLFFNEIPDIYNAIKLELMKKHVLILLFAFSLVNVVCAQKAPMKYGKVDQADLDMKVYPADSSAAAVVLCNYGYFTSRDFKFVHQIRIKILKE